METEEVRDRGHVVLVRREVIVLEHDIVVMFRHESVVDLQEV